MRLPRRTFLHLAAGAGTLPAISRFAGAVLSGPACPHYRRLPCWGTTDIGARLIAQWLSERLGQQFIVENRPGAGTHLATEAVARASADGYTLLMATGSNAINATLYDRLNYNFLRDIAPIVGVICCPFVLEVYPAVPVKTVPKLIAYAKASSGENVAEGRHPPARRSRSRRRAIAGGARSRGTSGPSKLCERPPAGVGDPDAGDIERPAAGNDRVGSCGCKTGADQLGQHLTLEAVGQKDCLGAAVGGRVEQFERPAPVALGAAGSSPSGCRHLGTRAAALVADSLSPPDEVHNPAGGQSRSSAAGSSKRNSVAASLRRRPLRLLRRFLAESQIGWDLISLI